MSIEDTAVLAPEETREEVDQCTHHWVIDSPNGPVSRGVCKICGAEHGFRNYAENAPYWENDEARSERVAAGVAPPASDIDSGE